jgi:hypothetical protein
MQFCGEKFNSHHEKQHERENGEKAAGKIFDWFALFKDGQLLWKIMYTGHQSTLHTEKSVVDFCYAIHENRRKKICKAAPQLDTFCTRLQMIFNSRNRNKKES